MKRKWFHTKEDPLYISLLLVVVLFFISVLAACFSFLIMSDKKMVPAPDAWQRQINEGSGKYQGEALDPEDIKVAQLSGEVVDVGENSIAVKTVVYSGEEKTYTITLPEESLSNLSKFVETGQTDQNGLSQIKKQNFDFEQLESGDFVTFSFPLEVPISEIESKSLVIEEIIVDDEYDASLIEE